CFVCGESGTSITCCEMDCDCHFHFPCAEEGGCITPFLPPYSCFCSQHCLVQAVEAAPEENTTCLICLNLVEDRKSYGTMVCPACKHAWFHRGCIQAQALEARYSCFQCLLCRDRDSFIPEMLLMRIRIPSRLVPPLWENSHTYDELSERHGRCDARKCLCLGGRERQRQRGKLWELLLCSSCAAEGTHRGCSFLSNDADSWECSSC
ncbi:G2E3 ligase, partial [Podargus strigoides]|nr:G2E3 ligase [Podargus strigoides]